MVGLALPVGVGKGVVGCLVGRGWGMAMGVTKVTAEEERQDANDRESGDADSYADAYFGARAERTAWDWRDSGRLGG